jgi:hypothetical protein
MWLIALKAIAGNVLVVVSAFGFGTWLSRFLPGSFSRFTRLICTTIGGFGLLGLLLFVVGQVSFHRTTIGIVLAIGVISAVASKLSLWESRMPIHKIPAAIVAAVLLLTALGGLAEPVGDWGVDGVAYHYVGPKVWLRDGIIRPIPDNAPTSYPSLVEIVFGALRACGGERAPGFSAVWTLALLLAIAATLGRRCGLSARGAWWVAALVATMGALYEGSHSGFVDAVYAAFILAGIRIGFDASEKKHFLAFGFFCGLAMSTKYPALVSLPALMLSAGLRGKDWKKFRMISSACIAVAAAFVVAAPIYLRNWILLGSPIYPPPAGAVNFLHVKYYSAAGLKAFYAYAVWRGNGLGRGPISFLLLPYNLTYHTSNFHGAGGIGLAPLAFGWLGVLASWREPFARRLALIGFLLLLLWFITMQESRYLIHFYAISAVFAVLGWEFVEPLMAKRGKALCATAIAFSVAYGFALMAKSRVADLHSVFSSAYAQQRRTSEIPYVESFDYMNRDPLVTRVLILDRSVPAYYSDKDYVKPFGQWGELLFVDASTPADILRRVDELHPSHILDVQSGGSGFCVPPSYPGLVLVFDRPRQKIYQVTSRQ